MMSEAAMAGTSAFIMPLVDKIQPPKRPGHIWLVNDAPSQIDGSRTLWHDLLEWLEPAQFIGHESYAGLKARVELEYRTASEKPALIIRNASYFPVLDLDVPQIALVQDLLSGPARDMQVEVCRRATMVVYNSAFTRDALADAELPSTSSRVCPLPVDFDLFQPEGGFLGDYKKEREAARRLYDIAPDSVCWVGTASVGGGVKGWDILLEMTRQAEDIDFVVVTKDCEVPSSGNIRGFYRLGQKALADVYRACRVGLCISRTETQHLAGLEMGATGLPLVVSPVGVYAGREPGNWGHVVKNLVAEEFVIALRQVRDKPPPPALVRDYWAREGFDRPACKARWQSVVKEVLDGQE